MSKGNSYWGTASGKIGNIVVSTNKGQRIERKYQPTVLNPKTRNQMLQRARFANAVKFYKRAYANFFRFAYEDKKQKESDFNAYMRHNTNTRMSVLKKAQVEGTFPCVCDNVALTRGSLGNVAIVAPRSNNPYLQLRSLNSSAGTFGEVSAALIKDYSLAAGDIVTIVHVETSVTSLENANPANYPAWTVVQFIVDTTDTTTVQQISENLSCEAGKGLILQQASNTKPGWNAVCFSRKQENKNLLVSNSSLQANDGAYSLYLAALQTGWLNTAMSSWGASGNAVLEGSLVGDSISSYSITAVNGNDVTYLSELAFDTGVSSTITLTGTGLSSLNVSDLSFTGGTISNLSIASDTEVTVTLTGNGAHPGTWTLQAGNTVIARHSAVTAIITSVSPSSSDKLSAAQSVTLTLAGTNLDALGTDSFTIDGTGLQVGSVKATGSTQCTVVLRATTAVTEATVKFGEQTIFTVKEVNSTITSPTTQTVTAGNNTLNLVGTDLDSLDSTSFTVSDKVDIVSYTASSSTAAALVISVPESEAETKFTVSLGSKWTCELTYKSSSSGRG